MFKRSSNWRDTIFAIGGVLLSISLFPVLWGNSIHAPAGTAATNTLVLAIFAGTYASMRFRLASATLALQALLWALVLIRVIT